MGPRWLAFGLALLLAASNMITSDAAAQAQATPSDTEARAREAFQRGRVHYDNGEFAQAADAFTEAYELSGRDVLLYNLYLAHRDANHPDEAAEALRGYLTKVEVIENRPQLEARLKALEAGIAERKAAAEQNQATPGPAAPEPETNVAQPTEEANPNWWIMPVAVASGGAAMVLGSIGTGLAANSKNQKLEDECVDGECPASLKSTADQGRTLSLATDVLLFGGLAVVGVGAVLFFLKRPSPTSGTADAAQARMRSDVGCSALGCQGSLTFSF